MSKKIPQSSGEAERTAFLVCLRARRLESSDCHMVWSTVILVLFLTLPYPRLAWCADGSSWSYLVEKLVGDGVDRDQVVQAFEDPRMPVFTGLEFSLQRPREPAAMYRRLLRSSSVAWARRCRARHADDFEPAARASKVSASVLAAILFVESGCGQNTGSHLVLHRLARLAMANEPENLQRNLERFGASDGTGDPRITARVRERARYLEDTFYPEVRATFAVANRMGVNPLELRGSPSGAFGYPQFLPTSYLRYGADGDGDSRISLYSTADAAASTAQYLAAHGWRPGLTRAQQRQVIWQYNRSGAYVDAVLTLAARIEQPAAATRRPARVRARHGARKHRGARTRHRAASR
jgi:membrane-bound lytic murein transglycosylase B